jgi:hypothetical protein
MKKIIIILIIIGLVIGFFYFKKWRDEENTLKARQAAEIIKLRGTVQEDSLTKSQMATTIHENEQQLINKSQNIKDLEKKYNTILDSHITLKTRLDSLISDRDTTQVVVDSTDSNTVSFKETFGGGWFEVRGRINRSPLYLYGLSLRQIEDIIFEVTLEKLPGSEEYVSFTHTNVPFITFKSVPVKVLDKRRWIDRVSIMANVSLGKFGAGASLFYNNLGAGYTQYTDGSAITLHYYKNLGEIF